MMRRGLGARESQSDTERVTRLPGREKTENRTKKGEKMSAPSKHRIYGYFCCFTSSHGQKKAKRIITQYFPCSPPSPDTTARSPPGPPPLFQMWQHSTTPLTRTKLPADPPKSFCLSYILLQRDRREARPRQIQLQSNDELTVFMLSPLHCHHCDPSWHQPRHHYRTVALDVIASLLPSPVSNHQLGAKAGNVLGLTSFINRPELSTKKSTLFHCWLFVGGSHSFD